MFTEATTVENLARLLRSVGAARHAVVGVYCAAFRSTATERDDNA